MRQSSRKINSGLGSQRRRTKSPKILLLVVSLHAVIRCAWDRRQAVNHTFQDKSERKEKRFEIQHSEYVQRTVRVREIICFYRFLTVSRTHNILLLGNEKDDLHYLINYPLLDNGADGARGGRWPYITKNTRSAHPLSGWMISRICHYNYIVVRQHPRARGRIRAPPATSRAALPAHAFARIGGDEGSAGGVAGGADMKWRAPARRG